MEGGLNKLAVIITIMAMLAFAGWVLAHGASKQELRSAPAQETLRLIGG